MVGQLKGGGGGGKDRTTEKKITFWKIENGRTTKKNSFAASLTFVFSSPVSGEMRGNFGFVITFSTRVSTPFRIEILY